jgi:malate synthase
MDFQTAGGVQVARTLYDFVNDEAIPGTGVESAAFWEGFGALVRDLAPRNKALLEKRDELQRQIDAWHLERRGRPIDFAHYTDFLRGIGYLQAEPADFLIATENVDPDHCRPTARRSGNERAVCVECCECALGQSVRCALRD